MIMMIGDGDGVCDELWGIDDNNEDGIGDGIENHCAVGGGA